MPTLTLLGLGPGDPALLTAQALAHLAAAPRIWLRTAVHPTVAALPQLQAARSFDALYESAADFAAMYGQIAHEVVAAAQADDLTYAVPGHPLVAEATTRLILALAREQGVVVRIIAGLSFVEVVCSALLLDPFAPGLQLLDALDLLPPPVVAPADLKDAAWTEIQGLGPYQSLVVPFPLVPTQPVLLTQLYHRRVASEVKLTLLEQYPASHLITVVRHAGLPNQQITSVPLHELDHLTLDHLSAAFVPALAPHAATRSVEGLQWVIMRLLGPNGCPWDREQTHQSLRRYLLEETYEALEALDADDLQAFSEELGDVLLQIVLHSEMGRQAGTFNWGDVVEQLTEKLIRRHPHVFGAVSVSGSDEVLRNWEAIKQTEHATQGKSRTSALDGVPPALPALSLAQQLTRKAAKVGFDWDARDGVWDKVAEELAELREVDPEAPAARAHLEEEFGDLLFALANLARWLELDAETALRQATGKFRRRFERIEALAALRGTALPSLDLKAMDALWEQVKREERLLD